MAFNTSPSDTNTYNPYVKNMGLVPASNYDVPPQYTPASVAQTNFPSWNMPKDYSTPSLIPTSQDRTPPPVSRMQDVAAGSPQTMTQNQRQNLWQAAGHSGQAPVGYGGESGGNSSSDMSSEFDSYYGGSNDLLNQMEAQTKAGEQDFYNQYTNQYEAQKPLIQEAERQGYAVNASQVQDVNRQNESALASARRLYQELTQGAQQRFGGTSSSGEFANQLFGREYQRNQGNIVDTTGKNLRDLSAKYTDIQKNAQAQLQQLEYQKQGALSQARNAFNDKLMAINNSRFALEQTKASQKIAALQSHRANIQQIEATALASKTSLDNAIALQNNQLKNTLSGDRQTNLTLANSTGSNYTYAPSKQGGAVPTGQIQSPDGGVTYYDSTGKRIYHV